MENFSAADRGLVAVETVGEARFTWRALGQHSDRICYAECSRNLQSPEKIAFIDESVLRPPGSDLVETLIAFDGLTSAYYRAPLLFNFCRDRARVFPNRTLGLNLPPIPLMVAAVLHSNMAALAGLALDAPVDALQTYYPGAVRTFQDDYGAYVGEIKAEVDTIGRMYLALVSPTKIVETMAGSEIEFGTLFAQDLVMASLPTDYMPPSTHADDFLIGYGRLIEARDLELHEAVIERQMRIVNGKATKSFSLLSAIHDLPTSGYQTLHYDDDHDGLHRITFRTSSSMLSNCGLTAWPAGYLLAEYCIARPPTGLRVLELGSGATGLVPVICARAGAAAVVATDFSDAVLDRLADNLAVNRAEDQVAVRKLDWLDPDDDVLREARPDLVLLADTVRPSRSRRAGPPN